MAKKTENTPVYSLLSWIKNYKIVKSLCYLYLVYGDEKLKAKVSKLTAIYIFFFKYIRDTWSIVYLHFGPRLLWQKSTMAEYSSDLFGWSCTEASVLGSQVFGQASIESCAHPACLAPQIRIKLHCQETCKKNYIGDQCGK